MKNSTNFLFQVLVLLSTTGLAQGQESPTVDFASQSTLSSSGNVKSSHIDRGNDGSLVTFGSFSNDVAFETTSGPLNLSALGNPDLYLARYDSEGAMVWRFSLGRLALLNGMDAGGLALDSNGNVFISGAFSSNVNFNPLGVADVRTADAGKDGFLAKYGSDGQLQWLRTFSSLAFETCTALEVKADGTAYVALRFSQNIEVDGGANPIVLSSTGGSDAALLAFDSSGDYLWQYQIGSSQNDQISALACHANGSIAVGASINASSMGIPQSEMMLAMLDQFGAEVWSYAFNNLGTNNHIAALTFDASGSQLYCAGDVQSLTDFDPDPDVVNEVSPLFRDPFIARYEALSGALNWVRYARSDGLNDFASNVYHDDEAVWLLGSFDNAAAFEPPFQISELTAAGGSDLFIAAFQDTDGDFLGAFSFGAEGTERVMDAHFDGNGSLACTGQFSGSLGLNPDAEPVAAAGDTNGFVAFFDLAFSLPVGIAQSQAVPEPLIYPLPASDVLNISGLKGGASGYTIYNIVGQLAAKGTLSGKDAARIDLSNLQPGVYILSLDYMQYKISKRIVKN